MDGNRKKSPRSLVESLSGEGLAASTGLPAERWRNSQEIAIAGFYVRRVSTLSQKQATESCPKNDTFLQGAVEKLMPNGDAIDLGVFLDMGAVEVGWKHHFDVAQRCAAKTQKHTTFSSLSHLILPLKHLGQAAVTDMRAKVQLGAGFKFLSPHRHCDIETNNGAIEFEH